MGDPQKPPKEAATCRPSSRAGGHGGPCLCHAGAGEYARRLGETHVVGGACCIYCSASRALRCLPALLRCILSWNLVEAVPEMGASSMAALLAMAVPETPKAAHRAQSAECDECPYTAPDALTTTHPHCTIPRLAILAQVVYPFKKAVPLGARSPSAAQSTGAW